MSEFEVKVRRVEVLPHPDPAVLRLALGKVDGYVSIIGKDSFASGDLGIYIPEGAVVPESILEEMDLKGALDGKAHNRVKARKIRGVLSQGLFYRPETWDPSWEEGTDLAEALGITKYEPPIPPHMSGILKRGPGGIFQTYTNIDSLQRWPDMFAEGEQVRFTEKLHGTACIVGLINGQRVVSSKGLAGRGVTLEEDDNNVYWRAAKQFRLFEALEDWLNLFGGETGEYATSALLFGEVLGVQDLKYGLAHGQIAYRAFDLLLDGFWEGKYVNPGFFDAFCKAEEVPAVPTLYQGPFSWDLARVHATGPSTLAEHIREGIVIRAYPDDLSLPSGKRKVAKLISPEYLVRKGETTEYE